MNGEQHQCMESLRAQPVELQPLGNSEVNCWPFTGWVQWFSVTFNSFHLFFSRLFRVFLTFCLDVASQSVTKSSQGSASWHCMYDIPPGNMFYKSYDIVTENHLELKTSFLLQNSNHTLRTSEPLHFSCLTQNLSVRTLFFRTSCPMVVFCKFLWLDVCVVISAIPMNRTGRTPLCNEGSRCIVFPRGSKCMYVLFRRGSNSRVQE